MKDVWLGCIIVLGILFGVAAVSFAFDEFFQPKYEALRTKTFRESQSYNDGMLRDLEDLKMQYEIGTAEQKAALKSVVIHRFSIYPQDKLPSDLKVFYSSLKGSQ